MSIQTFRDSKTGEVYHSTPFSEREIASIRKHRLEAKWRMFQLRRKGLGGPDSMERSSHINLGYLVARYDAKLATHESP